MKEHVFQTIWQIQQERKAANRMPENVTRRDLRDRIQQHVDQALEDLEADDRIESGTTINDQYFKIKTQ